jgi:hypothetical protein
MPDLVIHLPYQVKTLIRTNFFFVPPNFRFKKISFLFPYLDKNTVYSWGSGDEGRLGHGDTKEQLLPKEISAMREVKIMAICAGGNFSMALSRKTKEKKNNCNISITPPIN